MLTVVPALSRHAARPNKQSLYHAHLDFCGLCKGYERHMRRGSAVRSVYGYMEAIRRKYPNSLNYIFPSKRRIQERTFKWVRINRKTWVKSDENYSRRQIYSAIEMLTKIEAIMPAQKGWIVQPHGVWTKTENGVCRIRHLPRVLREESAAVDIRMPGSTELAGDVLPKNSRTRVTVLEDALRQKRSRS